MMNRIEINESTSSSRVRMRRKGCLQFPWDPTFKPVIPLRLFVDSVVTTRNLIGIRLHPQQGKSYR